MEVFTLRKTGVKNNFPLESWLFPLPKRRKWNEKQSEGENFRWRLGSSLTRRFCAWDATQNSQYNSICPPGRFTFLLLFKNGKTHQNVKAVSFPAARLKAESPCPAVIVVVDRTPPPVSLPKFYCNLNGRAVSTPTSGLVFLVVFLVFSVLVLPNHLAETREHTSLLKNYWRLCFVLPFFMFFEQWWSITLRLEKEKFLPICKKQKQHHGLIYIWFVVAFFSGFFSCTEIQS